MLIAMILLIIIGIVLLIFFTLCRVAALSDQRMQLMLDPEYLVGEPEDEDCAPLSDVPDDRTE